jgi:hypothetical protein
MDEALLSSAPSHSSFWFFLPSIFISSLYLPLLCLLPFLHNHLSHFIWGTSFLLLCCVILYHIFLHSFPWVTLSSVLQDQWSHQGSAQRGDAGIHEWLVDVVHYSWMYQLKSAQICGGVNPSNYNRMLEQYLRIFQRSLLITTVTPKLTCFVLYVFNFRGISTHYAAYT